MDFFKINPLFLIVATLIPVLAKTQPIISNFTPTKGSVGTLIKIEGNNLNNPSAITIGGVPAIQISNTGSLLVAMVMPGASTGEVIITTTEGTSIGNGIFSVEKNQPPNTQQGGKLVGTGAVGGAWQGYSVALSADGNTAIMGGPEDAGRSGAAWVYNRNGVLWSQQGNKLLASDKSGISLSGISVALSADGNTAIIGGMQDNTSAGAVWIFKRNGGVWTQQGNKLVGNGVIGNARQGISVALSADGNTALVGGYFDDGAKGAAWIFSRNGGVWTQQGNKLVGTGATIQALQGISVALSADGTTALVGGMGDANYTGAAWVFTRMGSTWKQQGDKLVGTGAAGNGSQGSSVAISADGNTAIIGGNSDNGFSGAAWVFTRTGGIWTQQGNKIVGTGASEIARQGSAVALSADGNTALIGGFNNNNGIGATWVFTRTGETWTQNGVKLVGTGANGPSGQGISVALSADGTTAMVGGNTDNEYAGSAWVFTHVPPIIYTFSGSGNWDLSSNWTGNQVPPSILPANAQIIINPVGSEECILNVPVTVPSNASIMVSPGKIFRIMGNLIVTQ